jgi:hypothetical protein
MELTQGKKQDLQSRGWPILEPGEELLGVEGNFIANEPGAFRFEDQWVEVVLSSSESSPDTLSINELSESLGGPVVGVIDPLLGGNQSEEESNPLWMWFAIVATTLLIIEMLWSRPTQNSTVPKNIHA